MKHRYLKNAEHGVSIGKKLGTIYIDFIYTHGKKK
jgi:hypothetical protein